MQNVLKQLVNINISLRSRLANNPSSFFAFFYFDGKWRALDNQDYIFLFIYFLFNINQLRMTTLSYYVHFFCSSKQTVLDHFVFNEAQTLCNILLFNFSLSFQYHVWKRPIDRIYETLIGCWLLVSLHSLYCKP